MHYHVTFLPRVERVSESGTYTDGCLLASKEPHQSVTHYYFNPSEEILTQNKEKKRTTNKQGVIVAEVPYQGETYIITTTHFTWTPEGETASLHQQKDMHHLLFFLAQQKPHVLTGDFNIPRYHNPLYEVLIKNYSDAIPAEYTSSLDQEKHHLGKSPEKSNLFSEYMVDYIFTQSPYSASDVALHFGISDHAAVVGYIERNET